jgi:CdiI immunity protein
MSVPLRNALPKLPTLDRLLMNYYHQDVWVEFSEDQDVWLHFLSHASPQDAQMLLADTCQLLGLGSVGVREYLRANSVAFGFRKSSQHVTWAKRLKEWLEQRVSSNNSLERTREG